MFMETRAVDIFGY